MLSRRDERNTDARLLSHLKSLKISPDTAFLNAELCAETNKQKKTNYFYITKILKRDNNSNPLLLAVMRIQSSGAESVAFVSALIKSGRLYLVESCYIKVI